MRVLLVQRTIEPPGGGNAVAAWMLQALAHRHNVYTLTEKPWDASLVDRFFGTSLSSAPINQRFPAVPWRAVAALPGRVDRLRLAVLLRHARQHAHEFDLLVTAENYAAFGRPGLQYVHYPLALRPTPSRFVPIVHGYYAACDALSDLSWESVRRNQTLANSQWTAQGLAAAYGIQSQVLYPPVVDPGAGLPWAARSNTFLSVGRFHGSKRLELAVSIVEQARAHVPDARLHIVGSNVDSAYTQRIRALCSRFMWLTLDENLSQQDLFGVMRRCRYGIHAMEGEHFGIGVAEMTRAGCLVFAHDSGGVVEIIDGLPELRWRAPADAVERIRSVASNPAQQQAMSDRLARHARRFSSERFIGELNAIVERFTSTPST